MADSRAVRHRDRKVVAENRAQEGYAGHNALVNHQEVDNAKELATRFDFKNTGTSVEWKGEMAIEITSSTEERCRAALEVFKDKLVKRQVSLKALDAGDPRQSGKETRSCARSRPASTRSRPRSSTSSSATRARSRSRPR
jgi:hypothetical protein